MISDDEEFDATGVDTSAAYLEDLDGYLSDESLAKDAALINLYLDDDESYMSTEFKPSYKRAHKLYTECGSVEIQRDFQEAKTPADAVALLNQGFLDIKVPEVFTDLHFLKTLGQSSTCQCISVEVLDNKGAYVLNELLRVNRSLVLIKVVKMEELSGSLLEEIAYTLEENYSLLYFCVATEGKLDLATETWEKSPAGLLSIYKLLFRNFTLLREAFISGTQTPHETKGLNNLNVRIVGNKGVGKTYFLKNLLDAKDEVPSTQGPVNVAHALVDTDGKLKLSLESLLVHANMKDALYSVAAEKVRRFNDAARETLTLDESVVDNMDERLKDILSRDLPASAPEDVKENNSGSTELKLKKQGKKGFWPLAYFKFSLPVKKSRGERNAGNTGRDTENAPHDTKPKSSIEDVNESPDKSAEKPKIELPPADKMAEGFFRKECLAVTSQSEVGREFSIREFLSCFVPKGAHDKSPAKRISFWDFRGSTCLGVTHQLFSPSDGVVAIVFNLKLLLSQLEGGKVTEIESLSRWIISTLDVAPTANILLIGNVRPATGVTEVPPLEMDKLLEASEAIEKSISLRMKKRVMLNQSESLCFFPLSTPSEKKNLASIRDCLIKWKSLSIDNDIAGLEGGEEVPVAWTMVLDELTATTKKQCPKQQQFHTLEKHTNFSIAEIRPLGLRGYSSYRESSLSECSNYGCRSVLNKDVCYRCEICEHNLCEKCFSKLVKEDLANNELNKPFVSFDEVLSILRRVSSGMMYYEKTEGGYLAHGIKTTSQLKKECEKMLRKFHDDGSLVYLSADKNTQLVVLKPEWLLLKLNKVFIDVAGILSEKAKKSYAALGILEDYESLKSHGIISVDFLKAAVHKDHLDFFVSFLKHKNLLIDWNWNPNVDKTFLIPSLISFSEERIEKIINDDFDFFFKGEDKKEAVEVIFSPSSATLPNAFFERLMGLCVGFSAGVVPTDERLSTEDSVYLPVLLKNFARVFLDAKFPIYIRFNQRSQEIELQTYQVDNALANTDIFTSLLEKLTRDELPGVSWNAFVSTTVDGKKQIQLLQEAKEQGTHPMFTYGGRPASLKGKRASEARDKLKDLDFTNFLA